MKYQKGLSIVENLVAISILAIAGFGFVAMSVVSIGMMRTSVERNAASRAISLVAEGIYNQRANSSNLSTALLSFPKKVVESEINKTYMVDLVSLNDYAGSAVSATSIPAHGILIMTLSTHFSERSGSPQSVQKTLYKTYTIDF